MYVLPAEDTGGQPLPVTCLRWRPNIENQNFKNILLATCKIDYFPNVIKLPNFFPVNRDCILLNFLHFHMLDASGSVKIWHVSTMDCLSSTQEGGRQVLACAFNASASQYITAGSDTTINLYDATTRQKLLSLEPR